MFSFKSDKRYYRATARNISTKAYVALLVLTALIVLIMSRCDAIH